MPLKRGAITASQPVQAGWHSKSVKAWIGFGSCAWYIGSQARLVRAFAQMCHKLISAEINFLVKMCRDLSISNQDYICRSSYGVFYWMAVLCADCGFINPGWNGQYHRYCGGADSRRARRHFLDVGDGFAGHVNRLCRIDAGADIQSAAQRSHFPRRPRLLHPDGVEFALAQRIVRAGDDCHLWFRV